MNGFGLPALREGLLSLCCTTCGYVEWRKEGSARIALYASAYDKKMLYSCNSELAAEGGLVELRAWPLVL